MTLIELGASSEAGIFNEAEETRRAVEANQKTLRDLLVLQQLFANTEGVSEEVLDNLAQSIDDFRARLATSGDPLENDLFSVLFQDSDPSRS